MTIHLDCLTTVQIGFCMVSSVVLPDYLAKCVEIDNNMKPNTMP